MRITEAARRLDMTPRMLRYRDSLGLLPALRPSRRRAAARRPDRAGTGRPGTGRPGTGHPGTGRAGTGHPGTGRPGIGQVGTVTAARYLAGATASSDQAGGHRQFSDADLAAVALGLSIERRYDISPIALAFGIRVLADPRVRAEVAELGRRIGRIQPPPARALDFEQERALRLLSQP
jgi:MerR family transcriptional regulator, copper efflux regulator